MKLAGSWTIGAIFQIWQVGNSNPRPLTSMVQLFYDITIFLLFSTLELTFQQHWKVSLLENSREIWIEMYIYLFNLIWWPLTCWVQHYRSAQHQRHRVFEVKLILTPSHSAAVKTNDIIHRFSKMYKSGRLRHYNTNKMNNDNKKS